MYNTARSIGAATWWKSKYTGKGIDVAVIDTGVAPVAGLDAPGKVVYGPDLSLESQAPNLTNLDTNGHGTFMASLIAGRDSTLTSPYSSAAAPAYAGIAPDARLVSLKVGMADGGTDVTQVIAAIDWVVQHAHDPGFNIRVINLSYGTNSTQAYALDPLAFAVEQAWKQGIVVVAAAGNTGHQRGNGAMGLADPAYDPYVIGVGAAESSGTAAYTDDQVAGYSAGSAGCGSCKNPDFLAPGSHMQGLRVLNSYIDVNHPEGRIDSRFFRGSGSSEAAAITSGAVALILQKFPSLRPDQVKRLLASTSKKLSGADTQSQGAGEISLTSAASAKAPAYVQTFAPATGTGSLELSRGSDHLTSQDGVELTGEQDIFGSFFNSAAMAAVEAAGTSWSGGMWNGNTWSGASWLGNTWSGNTWSGNTWSGNTWSGNTWSGNTWSGNTWSGNTWSGNTWSGNTWSGNVWAHNSWQGATWG
jgi:serine protease AprX